MTVHLPEMSVRIRRTQAILKYQLTSTRHEHRRLFQQFNTQLTVPGDAMIIHNQYHTLFSHQHLDLYISGLQ